MTSEERKIVHYNGNIVNPQRLYICVLLGRLRKLNYCGHIARYDG